MAKTMLGFDIGACELKMVLWDGKKVKRLVSVPMLDNLVKDGVIVSYDAMADFIKESMKGNRISAREAAVILPANYAFLRKLSLPKMTTGQLEVNLPYEFRDFLTQGKDRYFYDYAVSRYVKNEEGDGESIDLLAAATAKDIIAEYRSMFRRAGLKLAVAIPAECAYLNIIRAQQEYEGKEFCFLDLGHTATRLYIFTGIDYEVTRVIEVGLGELDRAIAEAFSVDEHMARSYKQTNYEGCQAAEGARSIYDGIGTELRRALNFYSFNNRESDISEIWCCGGGTSIPTLASVVNDSLEMQMKPVSQLLSSVCDENAEKFAAAIGAAMQGGK